MSSNCTDPQSGQPLNEADFYAWSKAQGGCPLPKGQKCHQGYCQFQQGCANKLADNFNKTFGCDGPGHPGFSADDDYLLQVCKDTNGFCEPEGFAENYDPNKPVCDNQGDYNQAFRNALTYNNKQNVKQAGPWLYVYLVLYIIFFVWGVLLAMRIPSGPERTLHVVLAIVFAPAYVLGYYLGMLKK